MPFVSPGDYIWIEPVDKRGEFDVAIGALVISADANGILVRDDDKKVRFYGVIRKKGFFDVWCLRPSYCVVPVPRTQPLPLSAAAGIHLTGVVQRAAGKDSYVETCFLAPPHTKNLHLMHQLFQLMCWKDVPEFRLNVLPIKPSSSLMKRQSF